MKHNDSIRALAFADLSAYFRMRGSNFEKEMHVTLLVMLIFIRSVLTFQYFYPPAIPQCRNKGEHLSLRTV
ncbi:hypothetical protein ACGFX8_34505 [Streptomyces sp. NPDC048362]|uniref:hypothetical protein n=1 Tax=Streptomyces sp. NPDC048362 TaxID=3365539 RepID=UPI003717CAA7